MLEVVFDPFTDHAETISQIKLLYGGIEVVVILGIVAVVVYVGVHANHTFDLVVEQGE